MAEGKKTFVAYTNWMATFEKLTDEEAGRLIKHLFRYVNDLDPEPPDRMIELVFEQFKQILKVDLEKWEALRDRNKINGAKGGRPKKDKEPKKPTGLIGNPKKPRKADNDNDNDNVNDNGLSKDNNSKIDIYPFDEFWNDYDKKRGSKEKLIKKWNKISDSEKLKIKEHIPIYKKAQPDKAFRKDPETFLKNKSWNDEIIISNGKDKSSATEEESIRTPF